MRTTLILEIYHKLKNQILAGTVMCLPFLFFHAPCCAQEVSTTDSWREDFASWAADADVDEATLSDWEDQMSQLIEQPFTLSGDTTKTASMLPFLTDTQRKALNRYLARNHGMRTASELLLIHEIDEATLQMLLHFVQTKDEEKTRRKSLTQFIAESEHEAVATASVPFYTTEGDRSAYLGSRYKHSLRYTMTYPGLLKLGFVAANDAGEPFFAGRNRWGYDYISPFLLYHPRGKVATVALGQYRLQMGLGLVMNTNLGFGKTMMLPKYNPWKTELQVHSSRSSSNYLQGAAVEIYPLSRLRLTLFASSRPIDATLSADGRDIQTISSSGYHRTESEMNHKNKAWQHTAGMNLRLLTDRFHLGLTAVGTALSKKLVPDRTALYRQYYPEGQQFWNASVYYGFKSHGYSLTGEIATGRTGGIATLHSLLYSINEKLSMNLVARHYSARYSSLYANSFGNNRRVSNETGAYLSLRWYINRLCRLQIYTDYAYSPKPRYGVSAASHEWDNALLLERNGHGKTLSLRYRFRLRQRDDAATGFLRNYTEQRFRLRWASLRQEPVIWQLQADAALSTQQQRSFGYMLSAMGGLNQKWFRLRLSAAYFDTDDYYSRLYFSESSLRYAMSMPMVYGQGCHGQLYIYTRSWHNLALGSRLSVTKYFDRSTIGSSYQRIDSSWKSNLELQIVWKLK